MEKDLNFFCGYGIEKNIYEKTHFDSSLLGNWLNELYFGIVIQKDEL